MSRHWSADVSEIFYYDVLLRFYIFFKQRPLKIFIIQRVKVRAIPCPRQPPSRGDNTVSVAQGGNNISNHLANRSIGTKDKFYGGARGVVVIAVGNEHGDTSSNPGRY